MTTFTANTWLQQLLGEWTYTFRTAEDSDHPGATATGTETVRAISGAFVAVENTGASEQDGSESRSVTLIGYEAEAGRFTGAVASTAVASLFVYAGGLSDDGQALLLETVGPAMTEGQTMDRYRDVIRIVDADRRFTAAEVWQDGAWKEFMRTEYRRTV